MSLSSLSGRVAALIATAVVLAVLLLGWFVLLAPQRTKVTSLDGQIADVERGRVITVRAPTPGKSGFGRTGSGAATP